MKLDGAIFAIEPRSVGACIDLAIVFVRQHFWGVMRMVAVFALPSLWLTWWLMTYHDWNLILCLMLFLFESPFCGAALVGAAGPRVFGEEFSVRNGLKKLASRLMLLFVLLMVTRVFTIAAGFALIIPAYLIAARYGFLAEIFLLEGCQRKVYETRLTDLMNQTYRDLVGRLIAIASFFSITVLSLFVLLDVTLGTLFNWPILVGRLSGLVYFMDEIETLLSHDPRVGCALIAVAWFVYPVTRLAWMFCYLDVRIRQEGWDVEIDYRIEARRLEAAA